MDDHAASASPEAPPALLSRETAEPAPLWHLGWMLGVVAAGAGLQAGLGAISWSVLIALTLGAVPGLVGYMWRPAGGGRLALLVLWSLGAVLAASLEGGVTGPLGLWCALPVLAGALLGATAEGAVLGAAALAATVLLQVAGAAAPAPTGLFGLGVSAAGLLTIGGAAVGVLAILGSRAREQAAYQAKEHAWLSGVMSELPHMALALDRDGLPEAVFGTPLPGLTVDGLRDGLELAVHADDRQKVRAAIREALGNGSSEAVFRPAATPDRWFALSLRRRAQDGLSALVREASAASPEAADLLPERRAAATRIAFLEQKLEAAAAAQAVAEAARADAETNAKGKSRFLANMSHELRTPLNAIMGFSDIMRAKMFGDLPPRYAEYAELIHESGRHLTDLINDVLDMSKIEAERYSLSREVFDAREAVNAALRLVRLQADDAGVTLRGLSPASPVTVDADRRALKQIVLNLVSNALKFTPRGGSVTVTSQPVDGVFELVVADTGVGIAKADLERLGRPFEQAGDAEHNAQGTGLGLSLVKAFARLHGGEMHIESELGEGVAVTVRLPVLVAARSEARPSPPAVEPAVPPVDAVGDGYVPPRPDPDRPRMGEVISLNLNR
ncbi:MAG TPA: HAMP domain-containing sensor histidine kinase [Caulobacteraceae bacterium]|nr:HAMP domain-containing sensor histidine kinase [Caulobacteraceae bacterium]